MPLQIADPAMLDEMLRAAAESPRRRAHKNFHESLDDPIHRHRDKFELMTVLAGRMEITLYEADGTVTGRYEVGPGCAVRAMEIPAGVFHGNRVLEPTVMLEVKPGPYVAVGPEDTLTL